MGTTEGHVAAILEVVGTEQPALMTLDVRLDPRQGQCRVRGRPCGQRPHHVPALSPPPEDQLPPGFPNIDMGPQLKVVERTRTATMLCAASGNPDPEITWFKDFLPVDPSASNGRIKQLRSGERGRDAGGEGAPTGLRCGDVVGHGGAQGDRVLCVVEAAQALPAPGE